MEVIHREIIQRNITALSKGVNLDDLCPLLLKENILEEDDIRESKTEFPDPEVQVEAFFLWYRSRGSKAFDVLIKSLRSLKLESLATLLESGSEDVGAGNPPVAGGLSEPGLCYGLNENYPSEAGPCNGLNKKKDPSSEPGPCNGLSKKKDLSSEPGPCNGLNKKKDPSSEPGPCNGLNKSDDPSEFQDILSVVREVEASCQPIQRRYSLSKFLPFCLFKRKAKTNEADATDSKKEEFQYLDVHVKEATFYNMGLTENVYCMQSNPRGYALVINNIRFPKKKHYRLGAEIDSVNLVGLLRKLGFEVTLGHNLTKKEFFKILEEFVSKFSGKSVDSCLVSIMSHGNDNSVKMCNAYKSNIRIWEDVIQKFNNVNCPALVGKPKIFLIQTCRGKDDDKGVLRTGAGGRKQFNDSVQDTNSSAVLQIAQKMKNKASFGDILLCYATIPGYTSTRDPDSGTWYTRSLCEVFMENAHDTEIKKLLDMVGVRMEQIRSEGGKFQTPSYKSIGFNYALYFNPGLYENNSKLPAPRKRNQDGASSSTQLP